jgi:hypothetical protein
VRTWATSTNVHRSSIERTLKRLSTAKAGKVVANALGKWSLTPAGIKAVEERA